MPSQRGRANDFLEDYHLTKDRVRRLELRARPTGGGGKFMDTHSFIVGGAVDPSLYIPPAHVYLPDPGEEGIANQVTSIYWNYDSYCRTGSVGVAMKLIRGGVESNIIDTTVLHYNDKIRAQITGGSGEDLTAWYVLIHEF